MQTTKDGPEISVVVPVYNERGNVTQLHREIMTVLRSMGKRFEVIFIDDCSTDGTGEELCRLEPVTVIKLRRNSGQSAALDAGIKHARGTWIVTLDGDGQNDPADIPLLWNKMSDGYDVVCGWRRERKDPLLKKFISRGARFLRSFLVDDGVHDAGCTLKLYRRECFEDLDLYAELHRMIPALLKWRGFRIAEVPVSHHPRSWGSTKYNWKRVVHGFLDMIYIWFWRKYSARPLHLFGGAGICLIVFGSALLAAMAYLKLFHGYLLSNKIWPLVGFVSLLIGIQLMVTGLLAAHLVERGTAKKYYVEQVTIRD